MSGRTGTEVAALELSLALRKRGHRVVIFSPTLGATATEARTLGVPVTNKLENIGITPDIIHGNHNTALALALVRFPDSPAVFVCHDTATAFDEPILDERIGLYVAVDAACRDRLLVDGVDHTRVILIPNAVDLDRFTLRDQWRRLPETALLIVKRRTDHVELVTRACRKAGITLEVVGLGVGNVVSDLAERCRRADIVLAHSRSAIEAAAVGAAVIVVDEFGYGGWFDREQILSWPETPLSYRILSRMPTEDELAQTMLRYDPSAAEATAVALRSRVDLSVLALEWERAYARAIANVADARCNGRTDGTPRYAPVAAFLSRLVPRADSSTELQDADDRIRRQHHMLQQYLDLLQTLAGGHAGSIGFLPGALGEFLLSDGWHRPEPWGVWSAAKRAGVWLPETVLAQWGFSMQVECARYVPEALRGDQPRSIAVFIGSRLLTTWPFSSDQPGGPERKLVEIPPSLRPMRGHSLLLDFCIDRPLSPLEFGEIQDGRTLGMQLKAFRAASGSM